MRIWQMPPESDLQPCSIMEKQLKETVSGVQERLDFHGDKGRRLKEMIVWLAF